MRHALALGRRGLGRTGANPSVGCVIVAESSKSGGDRRTVVRKYFFADDRRFGRKPRTHRGQAGVGAFAGRRLVRPGVASILGGIDVPRLVRDS